MENIEQGQKIQWTDNLRALSTIAVIFLHIAAGALYKEDFSSLNGWILNFYESAVRFSVPVFIMLTGTLLLPKNDSLEVFLKKRLMRIVPPFLFWSSIYIIANLGYKMANGNSLAPIETINFIFLLFKEGSSFHLWYVYMIIGLYLFIPIIGKWARQASEKEMRYFLAIWIYLLFINQPFLSYFKINIDLVYFTGYMGYLILGYYLSIVTFAQDRRRYIVMALSFIVSGFLITVLGTYFLSTYRHGLSQEFFEYLTPNVFLLSTGVFLCLKDRNLKNVGLIKIRDFISKYSYGIFLVHMLVLSALYKTGIKAILQIPAIGIPMLTIVCLSLSGVIIYLISKFPYGKYVSG